MVLPSLVWPSAKGKGEGAFGWNMEEWQGKHSPREGGRKKKSNQESQKLEAFAKTFKKATEKLTQCTE